LAQTGGTGGTSGVGLVKDDLTIDLQRQDGDTWVNLALTEANTYLNQARCQCTTPMRVLVTMASASRSKLTTLTSPASNARLYVGYNCANLNTATNKPQCDGSQLGTTLSPLSTLSANGSWAVETNVAQLFAAAKDCQQTLSTTIWLWIDTQGTGAPDLSGDSAPKQGLLLDGTPPAAPAGITVEGGDEALVVSWAPLADTTDLAGFLVFCMRGSGLQVFNPSDYNSNQYQTSQTLQTQANQTLVCSASTPATATAPTSAAGATTAVEVGAPTFFQSLDSNYVCSGLLPPSQNSARISILQNGIPYTIGVAAVDTHGNASPIQSGFVQRPVPTINFYQAYRDAGGRSHGGYCALAGRDVRLGAISFLAGTGFLALIISRRRRRARGALSRGLPWILVTLVAGSAQAQVASQVETDEMSSEQPGDYRTPKEWAIELRFGPYRPNVDSEFSGSPGVTPYKTVFGGKRHLMSQLELDWQFFQGFGSLASGVAIGYYSQSAKAFTADPTGACVRDSNDACVRSGDTTSLRLIPLAALLVYRWDVAAERWKIPLVPYAKLGLNYTFWQVKNGNGNVPDYKGGHGSGGTAGWQACAGMALLLDFLDPSAARNLDMETNVNHSYLFFEWDRVDATGLGMTNKLHVGDSRWVIGLMFEF
jgi:hypothetical protein